MKQLMSLSEVLASHLEWMYVGEKQIQQQLPILIGSVRHHRLKEQLNQYAKHAVEKRYRLKRSFCYLLDQPFKRTNCVIDALLKETNNQLQRASTESLRDVVLTAGLQAIICYNLANYRSALAIAMDIELQVVVDLLHEMLEWEKQMDFALQKIIFEHLRKESFTPAV